MGAPPPKRKASAELEETPDAARQRIDPVSSNGTTGGALVAVKRLEAWSMRLAREARGEKSTEGNGKGKERAPESDVMDTESDEPPVLLSNDEAKELAALIDKVVGSLTEQPATRGDICSLIDLLRSTISTNVNSTETPSREVTTAPFSLANHLPTDGKFNSAFIILNQSTHLYSITPSHRSHNRRTPGFSTTGRS